MDIKLSLKDMLIQRGCLLADGASGTNYFQMGLGPGDAPELWNIDHPERVADLYSQFIASGSDLLLTNSFGGNWYRLQLHKSQNRVQELNQHAARIAREVASIETHPILVAGSIGPTGELLAPLGTMSHQQAAEAFQDQATALAEGGADLLWIETMSSLEEVQAALEGAANTGLPICCTMSFDTNGKTMMGVSPADFSLFCQQTLPKPIAYGANCGTGASDLVAVIMAMQDVAGPDDILIAKANCGIPQFIEGKIVYQGTFQTMKDYTELVRLAGARIIGGCCGTTPTHLSHMRTALDTPPHPIELDHQMVTDRLGAFTSAAPSDKTKSRHKRHRRRSGCQSSES